MRFRWLKTVSALILLSCISAGCKRMPLYDLYTKVLVEVDIETHCGVELDMVVDTELGEELARKRDGAMPLYMMAVFYDVSNHEAKVSTILEATGGEVSVPAGDYNLVLYNFGTESTQITSENHRLEANAFTSDVTKMMGGQFKANVANALAKSATKVNTKGYEDDPIIYEPDHLYVANEMEVNVPAFSGLDTLHVIKTNAATILDVYTLEVLGVKGCEYIEKAEIFLTGQSRSHYFGCGEMDENPATLYMTLEKDPDNNRLYTVLCTFGKLPGKVNSVYLDITSFDGKRYRYVYDITDQFEDPENINHRLVIQDDINVQPTQGGGGLAPDVDDWDDVIIDLPL